MHLCSDPTILYVMHVLIVWILQIPTHLARGQCQGLRTGFSLEPARCLWLSQISSLCWLPSVANEDIAEGSAFRGHRAKIREYLGNRERDAELCVEAKGISFPRSHRPCCTVWYKHPFSTRISVRTAPSCWRAFWSGVYRRGSCSGPSCVRCQTCPS